MLPIAKRLKRYSVIPDLYGFGKTPHGDSPLNLIDYVKGALKILEKEGIEKVDVLGHSFGGRMAIMLASLYPEKINKIILCDSAGLIPRRGIRYRFKVWKYKLFKKLGRKVENCGSSDYKALSGAMRKTFVNVVNYDQKEQSTCIFAPTLIIWGSKDRVTPLYMAKKLKRNIKNSELFIISGAGHFSYADELNLFSERVNDFLGE